MKALLGIFLLAILCYYGVTYSNHMNDPSCNIDEQLVPMVNEWKREMDNLNIVYNNPFNRIKEIRIVDDSVVANLLYGDKLHGPPVAVSDPITQIIYIARGHAEKGYFTTRAAVWHELGHYIFDFDHYKGYYLMNEYTYTEKEYLTSWDKLKENYLIRCKKDEGKARF